MLSDDTSAFECLIINCYLFDGVLGFLGFGVLVLLALVPYLEWPGLARLWYSSSREDIILATR